VFCLKRIGLGLWAAVIVCCVLASEPADNGPAVTKTKCPTCEADGVRADAPKIAAFHCPTCKGSGQVIARLNGQNIVATNAKQQTLCEAR
jgi:hypothetical protein